MLRQSCEWKHVNIRSLRRSCAHVSRNTTKNECFWFCRILKVKSSQMIFERWANARFKYRNRSFWCRGLYVDSVGKNSKAIGEYIQNQLKEEHIAEQLELELEDSFTGKHK